MNKPKYQIGDRDNNHLICGDCGGKLVATEDNKLQCQRCLNYYVPLATNPSYGGWTDDDWQELHER